MGDSPISNARTRTTSAKINCSGTNRQTSQLVQSTMSIFTSADASYSKKKNSVQHQFRQARSGFFFGFFFFGT